MNNMVWFMLVIAGLFEVVWAVGLKYTDGFTRLFPSVISVVAMVLSVGLLGLAMKTLPIGTAYAVWVGVGVIGTALLGMLVFGESVSLLKMFSLVLIVLGIAGLKFSTA
jgi:quaternary ammonium compound-resistance protein SugE